MSKWEYCLLTGISAYNYGSGLRTDHPRLFIYTTNGEELVDDFNHKPLREKDYVAKAIFQLGEDGWELLSVQGGGLWFKRPKA
jgi:hypothetical protein